MRRFWKREREFSDLEAELRARRAEPPAQFVRALSDRVGSGRSWSRPRLRVALTLALVVLGAVAVVSAGGVGVAASGTAQLVNIVYDLSGSSSSSTTEEETVILTPSDDQYKPGKGCGDKNHEHKPKEGTGSADPTKPCPVQAGSKKAQRRGTPA
jgi:hypothetical protein